LTGYGGFTIAPKDGRREDDVTKETLTESSGNVFADLGLADAEEHRLKAGLVDKLGAVMANRGLTQSAAAKLTGISQPDLSRVLRGRFRDMSADRLIRALTQLETDIAISFSHRGKPLGEPIHLPAAHG
jgi:predicted XRE-type DNA-binding protein